MFILSENPPAIPVAPQQRSPSSTLLVVYPPVAHSTTASQIFLIGSAPAAGEVLVNGQRIRRSTTGNFSPSFPLKVGENKFVVEYSGQSKTIVVIRTLAQPELPIDGFGKDSLYPNVPIARLPGELICLSAIAPPNSKVTARLGQQSLTLVPGANTMTLADNLSVLTGKLETQAVMGKYQACLQLSQPSSQNTTLGAPIYELQLPDGRSIRETAKGTIDVLDPARLTTVEVTANLGVSRTGSDSEFARLTALPKGVRDRVTGTDGIWQRLSYGGWIKDTETQVVSRSGVPVESFVSGVTSRLVSDWTELRIPLQTPVPITVNQTDRTLQLTLHHTISQAGIQRLVNNPTISHVTWQQITPTQMQYMLHLKTTQAWGYKTRYEGNLLVLSLKNPPVLASNLKGIKILLDPGHGSSEDLGSVGNGGIPEKDVTIVVSKLLRDRLTKRGATVMMTREGDNDIGPNERAQLIAKVEPTIALSIHYNALPDAGDAEKTQGVSAFWYHPQSQSLAQFLHDYVTEKLDRKSDNVFWNNLALTRPTVAPSVLIELGYMINPEEYSWITDPVQQNRLANTLADGIEAWLRSR
ncbi:MAG: N-acetylmuramoyl-L-alanine amidase [Alkalinema sp. CAN_BIN05]|nr:N-acetylmuramoyl-L-alanine amidase [Alkalinema sp. CAN_BIN05]